MQNATRVTLSTFAVLAGIAGIEHGIGEVLQGNVAPNGMVIESWPESEWFRVLSGEPAMTVVPNLLVTGILAIIVSLVFLVWATLFVHQKHGGLVLMLLSIVMLLVGGGFGPPLLGIIVGLAATQINAPSTGGRTHLPPGTRHFLGALWPWSFSAALIAWLCLFPGSILLDRFVGMDNPELTIPVVALSAFGLLVLTIVAAWAHDLQSRINVHQVLLGSR